MAKIKYYYDTKTCRYERVKISRTDKILNLLGLFFIAGILAGAFAFAYLTYFPSKKELGLEQEKQELLLKYKVLNQEISEASSMLEALQERDNKLYRAIFEAEPIPMEMRKGGTGGATRYKDIVSEHLQQSELVINTLYKVDNLKKQMYIQTKSYDELIDLAKSKSKMMASIPAIQPIAKKDLTSFASGFGYRMHPIYKVRKMHTGCDLAAPRGTPIYASGDGKVIKADWSSGYGKTVEIDHGYGYMTRYAHMSNIKVRPGQKIKRGEMIGNVGSTGLSVSPHLHYEVHYNGKPVNPVNYFFNDLTPAEFDEMLEAASRDGQSLGGGSCEHHDH
ncbi:MAG: peptidoglycan DD-metalloendopeptidase family protein [Bernardetiaceae bacterium]|nr:peptidoglycan DD-metalloendopeptidase family protein [Bernardetiaceae bacterium]